jgi:hypothetical protein
MYAGAQVPPAPFTAPLQFVEQQSEAVPHASPCVRQVAPVLPLGTASHVPEDVALQEPWPEQHWDGLVQASPTCVQGSARQMPDPQFRVQQSASPAQVSPAGNPQCAVVVQVVGPPEGPSQMPEQHCVTSRVQAVPSATHWVDPLLQ